MPGDGRNQRRVIVLPVRTAILGLGGALVMFFLGVLAARGGSEPGGTTTSKFSFAGTITGITGAQSLTLSFKKPGASNCVATGTVQPGAFQTELSLAPSCDAGFFDGTDVTYDVTVGTTVVKTDVPVNPVPYAKYAERVGSPDCPVGYSRDSSQQNIKLCKKGADEMVRVGNGPSAFWIDRYEVSVWTNPDGTGTQYGVNVDDYPATFPNNGQWALVAPMPLYAVSKAGVNPSGTLTWFQALEACAASGKMLPGRQEWLRAAQGTVDPGASSGAGGDCSTGGITLRNTGGGVQCTSKWGAQDMIGNVREWTDEWYAGLGDASAAPIQPWPGSSYGADTTYNIASKAFSGDGGPAVQGIPSAAVWGGGSGSNTGGGLFNLNLVLAPSYADAGTGVRCIIRQ